MKKIIKKILKFFGTNTHLLNCHRKKLNEPIASIQTLIPIVVRKASREEVRRLFEVLEEAYCSNLKKYLHLDNNCYIAWKNGEIAGCTWVSEKYMLLDGRIIKKLDLQTVFAFGSYVFPAFRGNRIFEAMIEAEYRDAKENGFKEVISLANIENIPANKARQKFNPVSRRIIIINLPFGVNLVF